MKLARLSSNFMTILGTIMLAMPMTASTVVAGIRHRTAVPLALVNKSTLNATASSLSADRTNQETAATAKLPASPSSTAFTPSEVHAVRPDGTGTVKENADANGGVIRWYLGQEPADIKPYLQTPRSAGLGYETDRGWFNGSGVAADQCVGFASSYFYALWQQKGSGQRLPRGTVPAGGDAAADWAQAVGGHTDSTPHAGAIAGTGHDHPEPLGTNPYGHTFVVIHVLANGDIICAE
ncbi:CHAP domain-containing protein [[Lactobacillus] timonensis]|uniref:CHAP domain-containing protein n=1 Tax=[Lactobacillus] timonensis TaxID=1970790 RepID=UPI000C830735|nr:CHAP domain-containing protein [[Lactobacillus] timonensis]